MALIAAGLAFAAVLGALVWMRTCGFAGCPTTAQLQAFRPSEGSRILDREGVLVGRLNHVRRLNVPLDRMPGHLRAAFIAVEDRRFYHHGGVDWRSAGRAAWRNLRALEVREGFSTISMQVVRSAFLPHLANRRSLRRKLIELELARRLERALPKQRILELYLNVIYLGNGTYGVEAASRDLFGKSVERLSLAEAATLAGIARGPAIYAPRRHPDRALARRNLVLGLMAQQGSFVYAAALADGITPATVLDDSPVVITDGPATWRPVNYGGDYAGPLTLRRALMRSANAATVRLSQQIGAERVASFARRAGISSRLDPVPALALGALEVTPLELTAAYAAFANGGVRVTPTLVRRIETPDGGVLWRVPAPTAERVLGAEEAFQLTSMLRSVVDEGTGSIVRELGVRGPVAGKTGTTNNGADVWFVGYTPQRRGGGLVRLRRAPAHRRECLGRPSRRAGLGGVLPQRVAGARPGGRLGAAARHGEPDHRRLQRRARQPVVPNHPAGVVQGRNRAHQHLPPAPGAAGGPDRPLRQAGGKGDQGLAGVVAGRGCFIPRERKRPLGMQSPPYGTESSPSRYGVYLSSSYRTDRASRSTLLGYRRQFGVWVPATQPL